MGLRIANLSGIVIFSCGQLSGFASNVLKQAAFGLCRWGSDMTFGFSLSAVTVGMEMVEFEKRWLQKALGRPIVQSRFAAVLRYLQPLLSSVGVSS